MRSQFGALISFLIFAVLEYYTLIALRMALRNYKASLRNSILGVYGLFSVAAWVSFLTIRSWNISEWPPVWRVVVVAFIMGFLAAKILIAMFMLLDDLRRLIIWCSRLLKRLFPQKQPKPTTVPSGISRSAFISRMGLLLGGTFMGGIFYGTTNRYSYTVERHRIPLDRLPTAFKGLKIVQISDIHAGSLDSHDAVAHGIELILKEKPDLILFTGDLVNNIAAEIEPYRDVFNKLKAPLGVFSVLGNHDYGDYIHWPSDEEKVQNLEKLKRYHKEMGWNLMMNEHIVFEREGDKIALLGVENWSNLPRFPKHGNLAKAHAGLENEDIPVKILMSHDPTHWDAQIRPDFKDIALTLSGHTHGMQFGLRLSWMKWSPVQYIYKQWAGLYREGNQYLNVNVGYGFLGYPGRLGILPEITVIELV